MNKKLICILSFLLMVCFSAGIFVQPLSDSQVALSTEDVSFWYTFCSGCKSDIVITLTALFLSMARYTAPFVMLLTAGQVFAMGFTSAYLLTSHPQGLPIICAILFPRCLIKIPIYVALGLLSFDAAKTGRKEKRKHIYWQPYAICAGILMLSSLLEAFLHLLIVSP